MLLKMTRAQRTDSYTISTLLVGQIVKGVFTAVPQAFVTMELPWKDDAADESCVPIGTYQVRPFLSREHGLCYRLHNPDLKVIGWGEVPAGCRSAVEIHTGNWARNSKGCILIGTTAGELTDPTVGKAEPAVLESDNAMIALRRLLGPAMTHTLQIENAT